MPAAKDSGKKRILFFPLSNVLGHLTRTLALAEEFEAQGHDVCVAMSRTYAAVANVLPPNIRILPAPEMYASATQKFGPIHDYRDGIAVDRANMESSDRLTAAELRRRGKRLGQMAQRDAAIIDCVQPDAIITDYHFTASLLPLPPHTRLFHISHILGYPSFYRRLTGSDFFPLDSGHILVPGSRSIEYWEQAATRPSPRRRESLCGPFRWRGWQRLHRDQSTPPHSDVFLFFGSTGNGKQIVPSMLRAIPKRYRVSAIAPGLPRATTRPGAHFSKSGDLERYLEGSDVVFCHGGHGTVMECILHRTPMAIFPHNIEQLEIGRRIEKMRLGVLVKRPYAQLSGAELGAIIDKVRADTGMKAALAKYSALLRRQDGPKRAVSAVLRSLATETRALD